MHSARHTRVPLQVLAASGTEAGRTRSRHRLAVVDAARTRSDIARGHVPILPAIFRLESNCVQPWMRGFSPPVFQTYWKYLDIDVARRRQVAAK